MYDLPEVRNLTDNLWFALATLFAEEGLTDVPSNLVRDEKLESTWLAENLLFSQTCGYPLVTKLDQRVGLIGTPCYSASGCENENYCSLLIVRNVSDFNKLEELSELRWAINGDESFSGYRLPLYAMAQAGVGFAGDKIITGGHRPSIEAVVNGVADFAWIDCVTFALLEKYAANDTSGVKIIGRSPTMPGLPYISGKATSDSDMLRLRAALNRFVSSTDYTNLREGLLISDFKQTTRQDYDRVSATVV